MIWASLLFAVELFHWFSHMFVLTGVRMLPRRDLVRQRIYFLTDLASTLVSYWIHGRALAIIILQNIQHGFYFITWDNSWAAKRVISWSSLDWDRGRWNQWDLVLGTLFDVLVHTMNVYFLAQMIPEQHLLVAAMVAMFFVMLIFFNPRLAWAGFSNAPSWVQKRTRPLTNDQRQDIRDLKDFTTKLIGSN